jgi:hypothetical protein
MEKLIAPKSNPNLWLVRLLSQRSFAPKIAVASSEYARQISMRVFYRIGKPRGHDEWSPSGVIWAVE